MFGWKKKQAEKAETASVEWKRLTAIEQLEALKQESHEKPVLIYKHSTRCGISGMTLSRLERSWTADMGHISAYYLDLIAYRDVSNAIVQEFGVFHESPQVILLKNGRAIYDNSHMGISAEAIKQQA
ncbi:bacillithiol system redox-active protein YtxJ [Roseivirga pacifica]|uniref:bacillithiol system redox-active protein YtxJ n=1 Tax=Roseivirga pacifica TaxID=1267423 RepID=UPI00227BFC37|nr:bacillithiol system redox-active protein YtxJ [Roseivirga pacifica]